MATVLLGGKPVASIVKAKADSTRLLDACRYWGQESSWWLHRVDRLTAEREALVAWCDTHTDWNDPVFRRRNRRATHVWGMRDVAREHLADIAAKVDDLVKRNPREMARLTEAFADAREGPTPLVRPTRRPIDEERQA